MSRLLFLYCFLILISCKERNDHSKIEKEFSIPIVSQSLQKESLTSFKTTSISWSYFKVVKKSFPADTLWIPVTDYVDSSISNNQIRKSFNSDSKNLSYDGFEIYPDFLSTIYSDESGSKKFYPFYPVYVVNKSSNTKFFPGKDSYAFGIQEALDSSGNWRPIEGRGFDFCGNGYWNLKILSKEFLVILVPKFSGPYMTNVRIRLKIGDMVYVSKAYTGSINYKQFFFEGDSYFLDCIKTDKTATIQDIFYGSIPLEINKKQIVTHAVISQQ